MLYLKKNVEDLIDSNKDLEKSNKDLKKNVEDLIDSNKDLEKSNKDLKT